MMSKKIRLRNFIFLCLSTGTLTLWQLPSKAIPVPELATSLKATREILSTNNQFLGGEIPSLPGLGVASDYLPIAPPTSPAAATEVIRLELRLGERKVYVFNNDELVARYPVAIGRAGWETPTGNFVVRDMIENPGWENFRTGEVFPPGEDNPLGVRWISFWTDGVNEIGFHGTPNEELIGQAVSHGCVRMRNQDVTALYSQVAIGTPVVVKP